MLIESTHREVRPGEVKPANTRSAEKEPTVAPRVLNTKNAAAYLGRSYSSLTKLRVYGGGPAFCKTGGLVGYRPEDLDAWLDENRRRSTSEVVR